MELLASIGAELAAWRPLWAEHAFLAPTLAWESDHAQLARALRGLSAAEVERLSSDSCATDELLGRWLPVARWRDLECVTALEARTEAWPRDAARDVPGRKWAQVAAFAGVVTAPRSARLVDWCAGKGHLARALAARFPPATVLAVERNPALADEATRLARRAKLPVEAVVCDVLQPTVERWIDADAEVCALHACGHLHARLFELAARYRPAGLCCAPCCYHLGGASAARPLSAAGSACWPRFDVADLRTAVQETVTANGYVRRRRRHLQSWQLGFDALQRELRGIDAYLPLPAVGTEALHGSFATFCRLLAARTGIELPEGIDFAAWEGRGQQRLLEVSALDFVRHRFRRLIELWLVLDRAQFLRENGYSVTVATFCDRVVSPRNLLLQARRID